MQVYGNLDELRSAIKGHYDKLAEEKRIERDNQVNALSKQFNQGLAEMKAGKAAEREQQVRKIKARVLNERRMEAKRRFESAREEMISSVLSALEQKLPSIAKGSRYIAFVRKHAPREKGVTIRAGIAGLGKGLKGKFVLDKGVIGVRLESQAVVHDFDLRSLLEAKQEQLRAAIAVELFGE